RLCRWLSIGLAANRKRLETRLLEIHRAACNALFEKSRHSRNAVTTRINTGDFLCRLGDGVTARVASSQARRAHAVRRHGASAVAFRLCVLFSCQRAVFGIAWAKPQFAGDLSRSKQ